MANMCINTISFSGEKKSAESFLSIMKELQNENKSKQVGTLPNFIDAEKYDRYFFDIQIDGETIYLETKWAPPIEEFKRISNKYPSLEFELQYEELGSLEYGVAFISKGGLQHIYLTEEEIESIDLESDDSNILLAEKLDEQINKFRKNDR